MRQGSLRSFASVPFLTTAVLASTLALMPTLLGCQSRTFNLDSGTNAARKTKPKGDAPFIEGLPESITTMVEYEAMLDKVFAKMKENRSRFWSANLISKKYDEKPEPFGPASYFDNEGEKVAWDAVQRCIKNNSSTATGGKPLSDLSHHYYCTLPGYMPDKKVAAAAGGAEESPLKTMKADEYKVWRTKMVNDKTARMWLHSGIRACFTYSLRGQLLQLDRNLLETDTKKTQYIKRTSLIVPDQSPGAAAGATRTLPASEHAGAFCLNDGRAANPAEMETLGKEGLDAKGKPFTPQSYAGKAKYLVAKEDKAPRPFEWLFADQADVFKFAMLPHPTSEALQKRLNAFYGVDDAEALTAKTVEGACAGGEGEKQCVAAKKAQSAVLAACLEKRPARRPELEPQDGFHCRLDRAETVANEVGEDAEAP